jgi:DNA invertase Pin-like site-specific DNA recombinase
MKYGYARVSTDDQNPALQIAALKKAKCAHIFQDKLTGATTNRPQLARCLKTLRAGDTLIVWKLDRLGRSLRDLITILDDMRDRGITIGPIGKHRIFGLLDESAGRGGRLMDHLLRMQLAYDVAQTREHARDTSIKRYVPA